MTTRTEHDTMGEVQVPSDAYWGAQTQRSYQNFKIGGETLPQPLIYAMALVKKAAALTNADLVITGEGRIDGQTRLGKVPLGVLRRAQKHNVPVIALAGVLGAGAETLTDAGFAAIFPSIAALAPLEETLAKGGENLERTARQIAAVLALGGRL